MSTKQNPWLVDFATGAQMILSLGILLLCSIVAGDCLAHSHDLALWPDSTRPVVSEVRP